MNESGLIDIVVTFVRAHDAWAGIIAYAVAFLESFCLLSLFWPGTAILIGMSALLAAGGTEPAVAGRAIIWAACGGASGYAASYWIGRYYADDFRNLWPFSRNPRLIESGQAFFDRWGAMGVFLGHFVGPVRAIIPVIAGVYAVPHWKFEIANIVSATLWAVTVIAPAYLGVDYFLH